MTTQNNAVSVLREALQFFIDRCDSGLAQSKTTYAKFKEVLAATEQAAIQPAGAVAHKIFYWGNGGECTLESLLKSLQDYSNIMPVEGRAQWAMREAARYIKASIATPAAQQAKAEQVLKRKLIGYGDCRCILAKYCDGKCAPLFADVLVDVAPAATPASKPEASELPFTGLSARLPQGWTGTAHSDGWIFFKRPDDIRATVAPGEPLGSHGDTLHMLMTALIDAHQPVAAPCQFPMCKSEAEQDAIAEQVHDAIYGKSAAPVAPARKDHDVREFVNKLRDIALEFSETGQLRERISGAVQDFLTAPVAPEQAVSDEQRYLWLVETFGQTALPCFLEQRLERGYIADGKASIDAVIDVAILAKRSGRTA